MPSIDHYMDAARARLALNSDRQLAAQLNVTSAAMSALRTKRAWPSDDTMVKLAQLAGLDVGAALLELSAWRSEGVARQTYLQLLLRLGRKGGRSAAAVLLAALLGQALPAQASATVPGTSAEQGNMASLNTVYYGKSWQTPPPHDRAASRLVARK